ncbi:chondroitin proteoglycan 2 [Trichonephila clavipes]|nr:chondroitin proteoglycan 2 [Trichonephila clavipes]
MREANNVVLIVPIETVFCVRDSYGVIRTTIRVLSYSSTASKENQRPCSEQMKVYNDSQTSSASTEYSQYTEKTNFPEISTKHFSTDNILIETTYSDSIVTDSSSTTDKISTSSDNVRTETITSTSEFPLTNRSPISEMTVSTEKSTTVSYTPIETTSSMNITISDIITTSERGLSSETTSSKTIRTSVDIVTGSEQVSTETEVTLLPKTETTSDDSSTGSEQVSTETQVTLLPKTETTSDDSSTGTEQVSTETEATLLPKTETTSDDSSTRSEQVSTETQVTLLPKTETTSGDSSTGTEQVSTEGELTLLPTAKTTSDDSSTSSKQVSTETEITLLPTAKTTSGDSSSDSSSIATEKEPISPTTISSISSEVSTETVHIELSTSMMTSDEDPTNPDHVSTEEVSSPPTIKISDEISTEKKPTPTTDSLTTSESNSSSSSRPSSSSSTEKEKTSTITSSDEINTNSNFSSTKIQTTSFTNKDVTTAENISTVNTNTTTRTEPTSRYSSTAIAFTTGNNFSTTSIEISTDDAIKTTTVEKETTSDGTNFTCPTRFGIYPDSKNCNKFYHCSHWTEYHKTCPSNLHFNPGLQVCDWPYRAGCERSSSTTITVKSTTTSKPVTNNDTYCDCDSCELPIPENCNSYILCIDRKVIPISCGSELNFNPMTGTCDWEENVQCEENIQCPEPTGRFPYPHSCTHIMDCKNSEMTIKKCPESMTYDAIAETCSWSASCEGDKTSTETTTSTTIKDYTIVTTSDTFSDYTETTRLFTSTEISTSSKQDENTSTLKPSSSETTTGETSTTSFTTTNIPTSTNNIDDVSTKSSSSSTDEETTTTVYSSTNTEITASDHPNTITTTSIKEDISTTILPLTTKTITDSENGNITSEDSTKLSTSVTKFTSSENITSTTLPDSSTNSDSVTPLNVSSISTHEATTTSSSDFLCPSRFGLFPDPENCFRFYHCSHWKPHHKWCPSGLHFNPELQVCDWPYRAGCGKSLKKTTPDTSQGKEDVTFNQTCDCECCFYPDKNDCSRYMLCLNGVLHKGQCAEGLLFDPASNNCDLADRVKCPLTSICVSPSGIYSHPSNCSVFYRCDNGRPFLEKCLNDKHFSVAKNKCVEPCEAKCDQTLDCVATVPSAGVSDSSICIEDEGLYPVKNDCSAFYQCTEGNAYFVRCPDGLHFNAEYGVCELPCDAKCDLQLDCPLSSVQVNSKSFEISTFYCPRPNGLFPAPQDCSSYYLCSRGKKHHLYCPPGMHFSVVDETCESPCKAQCSKNIECPHPVLPKNKEVTSTSLLLLPIELQCKTSNGKFSNPNDCSSFYICLDGKAHLEFCSNGLHFDPEDKKCKSPCIAGCDTSIECPTEIPRAKANCSCENCFLPDATDCSAYYFCSQNYLTKGYCPYGMLFDRQTSQCQNQTNVICEAIGDPALCKEPYGIFSYPGYCKKFVHCIDSVAHIQNCEDSLEFDAEIRTCTNPKGYCGLISKDPLCETADGLIAHQTNCSQFYQCENWTAYLKSCPSPLIFNAVDQVCDWPHNFQCNISKALARNSVGDNEIETSINNSSLPSNKASLHKENSTTQVCQTVPGVICPCACRVTTYDDCSSFYHCRRDGKACKKFCPQGLYFNKKTMVCDLPQNIECRVHIALFCSVNLKQTEEPMKTSQKHGVA